MSIYKHISGKVTGKIQGILKRIPCGHPVLSIAILSVELILWGMVVESLLSNGKGNLCAKTHVSNTKYGYCFMLFIKCFLKLYFNCCMMQCLAHAIFVV